MKGINDENDPIQARPVEDHEQMEHRFAVFTKDDSGLTNHQLVLRKLDDQTLCQGYNFAKTMMYALLYTSTTDHRQDDANLSFWANVRLALRPECVRRGLLKEKA